MRPSERFTSSPPPHYNLLEQFHLAALSNVRLIVFYENTLDVTSTLGLIIAIERYGICALICETASDVELNESSSDF